MDYEKLGFKCGIEIHQQLETHKLFCHCPSLVNDENEADIFFERKLKAIAGETGEVDKAAQYERSKNKAYKYEGCSTSCCLVEMDEEPPHALNKNALKTALEVAMLLNANVVDKVMFMRKTVIDGSNVSGFQRTALIATDGYVNTSKGKVKIESICLEEEAAKKLEDKEGYTKYRLDRLGVALLEIATDASIKDPEHAKEVASIIGMVLRSTNKVKRGIGTIRQDVNVSIKGKERVEIKGFQELKYMPKVIENEVKRQIKLKKSQKEVRKANPDGTTTFLRPMPGAARMYPETDVEIVDITKELLDSIKLPELLDEKALRYEKEFNLNADLAKALVKRGVDFDIYVKDYKNVEPTYIATILTSFTKELKRKHNLEPKKEDYAFVLDLLNKNKIPKNAVQDVLMKKAKGETVKVNDYAQVDDAQLKTFIEQLVKDNPDAPIGGLMGDIMKHFKGKVDGKKAMEILKALK
ncbi:Glu-tRNA(Gln) amidotransferase GatDE subunit E [Candidatus Woesearchaeota archaeon]|nr:MAG: Glu-tRNA(Gln) amidotransferase GatDE subunit E [Candidatus Woesearchaeota archaeon]